MVITASLKKQCGSQFLQGEVQGAPLKIMLTECVADLAAFLPISPIVVTIK